jgi:hypothetical protein
MELAAANIKRYAVFKMKSCDVTTCWNELVTAEEFLGRVSGMIMDDGKLFVFSRLGVATFLEALGDLSTSDSVEPFLCFPIKKRYLCFLVKPSLCGTRNVTIGELSSTNKQYRTFPIIY